MAAPGAAAPAAVCPCVAVCPCAAACQPVPAPAVAPVAAASPAAASPAAVSPCAASVRSELLTQTSGVTVSADTPGTPAPGSVSILSRTDAACPGAQRSGPALPDGARVPGSLSHQGLRVPLRPGRTRPLAGRVPRGAHRACAGRGSVRFRPRPRPNRLPRGPRPGTRSPVPRGSPPPGDPLAEAG